MTDAGGARPASDVVNHCVDCCCARSWSALGVPEYDGKSIPEHITRLRDSEALARGKIAEQMIEIARLKDHYETGILAGENDCKKHAGKVYMNCVVCRAERAEARIAELHDNGTRLREAADSWKEEAQRNQRLVAELERERNALAKDAEQSGTMLQWILSNAEYRLGVNSLGKPNYYVVPAEVIDAAKEKPPNDGFGEIDKRDGFGLAGKAVPPPGTSARDEWRGGCGKEKP